MERTIITVSNLADCPSESIYHFIIYNDYGWETRCMTESRVSIAVKSFEDEADFSEEKTDHYVSKFQ